MHMKIPENVFKLLREGCYLARQQLSRSAEFSS